MSKQEVGTETFVSYKKRCVEIAKQLYFPQEILKRLAMAQGRREVERLMIEGRQKM